MFFRRNQNPDEGSSLSGRDTGRNGNENDGDVAEERTQSPEGGESSNLLLREKKIENRSKDLDKRSSRPNSTINSGMKYFYCFEFQSVRSLIFPG